MNQWQIDKINESMSALIESNNARLTAGTTLNDEENERLTELYSKASDILLKATQRHVKNAWINKKEV